MVLFCVFALIGLLLSLLLTRKSFQLLRLRRELREQGQDSTPQVDKAATVFSVVSALTSVVCTIALAILLIVFLHLQLQAILVLGAFAVARWTDTISRRDKVTCPLALHWTSDMAVQFTTAAVLAAICTLVAIPLSALPLAVQLLFMIVSSWLVVSAMWQWRERIVNQDAFHGIEAVKRRNVIAASMRRYMAVYSFVFSLFGILDWAMTAGLIPRDNRIWFGAFLLGFFFTDFLTSVFAHINTTPTKSPEKQAIRN